MTQNNESKKQKIIDAHHHYWDPDANYHPWLRDEPMIPFRYGDYSSIRQRFMPRDYAACTADWNVIASVTMEGEWNPADPCGEAIWMQALADETGQPAAHVAQAWLDSDGLEQVLACYDQLSIVRSIRHKPRANPQPEPDSGGLKSQSPGGMMDQAFRDGFKRLADHDLMFDLQTPWWHLHEAIDLANSVPEVPIILNHAGLPSDRSPQGLTAWRDALKAFSELPKAYIKISGLGIPGRTWSIEDNYDVIKYCLDTFGPKRAMFASNFPVDGLCGSFETIYSGFSEAMSNESASTREAVFWKNAADIYKLDC